VNTALLPREPVARIEYEPYLLTSRERNRAVKPPRGPATRVFERRGPPRTIARTSTCSPGWKPWPRIVSGALSTGTTTG
jgi:hypothetical protein